jgi:hypothetical protein
VISFFQKVRINLTRLFILLAIFMIAQPVYAFDPTPLWDFKDPAVSEQRFVQALATAQGDDALIIKTQIARSYGLRKNFVRAQKLLRELEPSIGQAGPGAQTRNFLEIKSRPIS